MASDEGRGAASRETAATQAETEREQTEAVQRMQTYIQENIDSDISPAKLADIAHFSPWHSARLFKGLTGLSPADYIRRIRLSRAALRLRDENVRILDVALDAGFSGSDGFQRAFRKEFGCNPGDYAKNPCPLELFTPYGVKFLRLWEKERKSMGNVKSVFVQVVEKPARKVIIKRGEKADSYMSYCEEVGCDVWGVLTSIKSISGEPVCMWLPQNLRAGMSEYVQGAEVAEDYDGKVPEGFDVISLPAAKYLMFQGEPFAEEEYCEAITEVQEAMAKYEPSVIGYVWDDSNPRIQLEPVGARGYIELRSVKV